MAAECLERLATANGVVTEAARHLAYQAVTSIIGSNGQDIDRAAFEYQVAGWPADWQTQLAVALDVPCGDLDRVAVGGPLPISDLIGVSVKESLRYFERVVPQ